jgi:hypothetical protein
LTTLSLSIYPSLYFIHNSLTIISSNQ